MNVPRCRLGSGLSTGETPQPVKYWIAADCGHKCSRVWKLQDGRELCPSCMVRETNRENAPEDDDA